jgi:hypothetical protein
LASRAWSSSSWLQRPGRGAIGGVPRVEQLVPPRSDPRHQIRSLAKKNKKNSARPALARLSAELVWGRAPPLARLARPTAEVVWRPAPVRALLFGPKFELVKKEKKIYI